MKKVLFVATVVRQHINVFHLPYLKLFKDKGWETSVCAKNDFTPESDLNIPHCDKYYDLQFHRFPFKFQNIKVYKQIKKLIRENHYDIIHCHTPVGGVLARLAAIGMRKKGTKVIYTAHGFHFYKGAPILNWLIYYPIEWLCSFFTDSLITINEEDFARASKYLHAKKTYYIPGIGVDTQKYNTKNMKKSDLRQKHNIPEDAFLVLSVGEINKNKNHKVILDALNMIPDKDIYYVLCGVGDEEENLLSAAKKYGMEDRLKLMGYQNNISEWLSVSDLFAFPSIREGLSKASLEAMSAGIPQVTSNARGIKDYMGDGKCGFSCDYCDAEAFAQKILLLKHNEELRKSISEECVVKAAKYDIEKVKIIMDEIYEETVNNITTKEFNDEKHSNSINKAL